MKIRSHEEKELRDDALSALVNLGYSSKAAGNAVDKALAKSGDMTLERVITEALRVLV